MLSRLQSVLDRSGDGAGDLAWRLGFGDGDDCSFERGANQSEQFAVTSSTLPRLNLRSGPRQQILQGLTGFGVPLDPLGDRSLVCDQSFAPVFGRMHQGGFGAMLLTIALDDLADCIGVGITHQTANVLHLTSSALVGPDTASQANRVDHLLAQRQQQKSFIGQFDQTFAKRLQRMAVALALRLAGRVGRGRLISRRAASHCWRMEMLGINKGLLL